ncbi:hypothetical protein GCM10027053_52140 [Intrasporangium mesophilum]
MKDTHTTPRSLRSPDEEWLPAAWRAAQREETLTDVLRRALREYTEPREGEGPVPPLEVLIAERDRRPGRFDRPGAGE